MNCVYKCAINPITNPNPFYSHTQSRDNTYEVALEDKLEQECTEDTLHGDRS
jgi:hypothetical protein